MERDTFMGLVRDRSQFEESAASKVSDTRLHESAITNTQVVTAHSLAEGRTITEKLNESKYEVISDPNSTYAEPIDIGEYRTETELHSAQGDTPRSTIGVTDSGKEEIVSSNMFEPVKSTGSKSRTQSYMSMISRDKSSGAGASNGRYSGEDAVYRKSGHGKEPEQSSSKYSNALSEGRGQDERSLSSVFKGGQMKGDLSDLGKSGSGLGSATSAQVASAKGSQLVIDYKTGKVSLAPRSGFGGKSAVYGTSEGGRLTKYGKLIPNRISQKAKGSAETKANNISKTKSLQRDAFAKKADGGQSASSKFQSKIGDKTGSKTKIKGNAEAATFGHNVQKSFKSGGGKKNGKKGSKTGTVARGTAVVANYRLMSQGSSEDVQNASSEAAIAGARGSYSTYGKLNRRRNNANAQKFLGKSKYSKAANGGKVGATASKMQGKYGAKASKSMTQAQANARKAQAAKRAQQAQAAKKFKQAKHKQEQAATAFQEIKQVAIKVARKIQEFARRNITVTITVAVFLITIIVVSAALGSCAMAFTSGSDTYMSGMSSSTDPAMTESDSYFKEKEMLLQERIDNIQEEYPDYDEYILDIDDIEHDSLKLMAFLSAEYEGYTLDMVQSKLDELFDEMYTLTITPRTEIRTRMVEKTGINPATGEEYTYEVEESYEWKILEVKLERKDWDALIADKFTSDSNKEMYEIYDDTDGAHQAFYNPFTTDWSSHISSKFGWRIHPTLGYEKFHNGVDIALPQGTEIHACATGKVITATYSETAGNYVVIQDATGYTTHYMHLSVIGVSVGDTIKHGDIIGKVGTTGRSTGPHLHLGIKDNNGNWLNPEFLVSTKPYSN